MTLMTIKRNFEWKFKMYRLLFKTNVDLGEMLSVPSICDVSKRVMQLLSKSVITDNFLSKHCCAR